MTSRRLGVALGSIGIALVAGDLMTERLGAHAIVDAPNAHAASLPATVPGEQRIPVGPPAATLSVGIENPRLPPRATIFVLHGIRDQKENVRSWAEHLTEAGYRAVLVDSRGHGRSSGEWLTYGVQESRDLSQVLDALAVDGPIGVMGISYGAATAIEWAAHEPRVKAAVAVAPFASLRDVVPVYVPRQVPLVGWLLPRFVVMRTVDAAGRMASFSPDEASPRDAVRRTKTPILLVHGRDDMTVPYWQSERIADGSTDHVTLVGLDGQNHENIAGDARLWPLTLEFLERACK